MGMDDFWAGIFEHETACAVGVLGFAGGEAGLAHEGGLLVAENSGYGYIFYGRK